MTFAVDLHPHFWMWWKSCLKRAPQYDSDTEAALPDGIMPIKYQEAEELAAQCLSATDFADEDTETDGEEENSEWEGSDEVWAMATTQQLYNSLLLLLLLLGWKFWKDETLYWT